jgi:hypothetical protein
MGHRKMSRGHFESNRVEFGWGIQATIGIARERLRLVGSA